MAALDLDNLDSETLWIYYQRGYVTLVRSGRYFRQLLRPAFSHVYFLRAIPLLMEYSRANRDGQDLPFGFGDQMEACPLTGRDLLHLDYAISLGYVEAQGLNPARLVDTPIIDWPGPGGYSGVFIASDAVNVVRVGLASEEDIWEEIDEPTSDEERQDDESDEGEGSPPFDL